MCGITGIIKEAITPADHESLQKMTDSLIHRGPEYGSSWNNGENLLFGHRRLCIIDIKCGAQPMHYMDRYTIVFNGAIYNYLELKATLSSKGYQFHTASDTEVILALYAELKEDCLAELDGMFAFAIFDKQENKLFCARDRFGEKPFYYHYREGKEFLFGSEMKALWAAGVPKIPSHAMLYNYFMFGYVENVSDKSQTFFDEIIKLPPAHYCILDCNTITLTTKRYWDINWKKQGPEISIEDAQDKLRMLFERSVRRRLRSDVSVGSSLSGGIDSSLIAMMINDIDKETYGPNCKHMPQRATFSAQFPGFEKDESFFQELVTHSIQAKAYATVPNEHLLITELDKVMYHQEEPFHSASVFAQFDVYKLAAQNKVTVLLDGQGADEVLAGYTHYYKPFFKELYCKNKPAFNEEYQQYIETSTHVKEIDLRFRIEANLPQSLLEGMANRAKQWKYRHVHDDLEYGFKKTNKHKAINFYNNPGTLNQALYESCTTTGLENLLRYADRNSMAHSREVRLPFLSHELVEFFFSLPAQFKIHHGWTKYLLRKSFEYILPQEITWRKDKTGFEPPQKTWMQNPRLQDTIRHYKEILVQNKILKKEILDRKADALAADEKGDNSWQYFMAGKLLA